jgi:hypothetical protein
MQRVMTIGADGGRQLKRMLRGLNLLKSLLSNVRSKEVEESRFRAARFKEGHCIVPAEPFYEWAETRSGPKPQYEFTVQGVNDLVWPDLGDLGEPEEVGLGSHICDPDWEEDDRRKHDRV